MTKVKSDIQAPLYVLLAAITIEFVFDEEVELRQKTVIIWRVIIKTSLLVKKKPNGIQVNPKGRLRGAKQTMQQEAGTHDAYGALATAAKLTQGQLREQG